MKKMPKKSKYGKGFDIKDNTKDGEVKSIDTMTEDSDMGRMDYDDRGDKGYSSEAWNYKY